jgi:hypothetical protein
MCNTFKSFVHVVALSMLVAIQGQHSIAQSNASAEVGRAAMTKLAALAGHWEGEATVTLGPGQVYKVKQKEHVQYKLDGNVLLIEGTGREMATDGEGKVVFQAMAVCTFDPMTKKYQFHAFRDNGMSKVASAEVTETGFIWGFEDGRGGKVRYTITVADDTWVEVGEYLVEGMPPRKIFEMAVKRIADPK